MDIHLAFAFPGSGNRSGLPACAAGIRDAETKVFNVNLRQPLLLRNELREFPVVLIAYGHQGQHDITRKTRAMLDTIVLLQTLHIGPELCRSPANPELGRNIGKGLV